MKLHEKQNHYSDKDIPSLARKATREAYTRSVQIGNGVVIRKDNDMVRVDKGDVVLVIKQLPPLIHVKKGARYTFNG